MSHNVECTTLYICVHVYVYDHVHRNTPLGASVVGTIESI